MEVHVDILRYYLGQWFTFTAPSGRVIKEKMHLLSSDGEVFVVDFEDEGKMIYGDFFSIRYLPDFKLHLRTSMTDEEETIYYGLCKIMVNYQNKKKYIDTPKSLAYITSIGVDCFDLIESGIAIDKDHETSEDAIKVESPVGWKGWLKMSIYCLEKKNRPMTAKEILDMLIEEKYVVGIENRFSYARQRQSLHSNLTTYSKQERGIKYLQNNLFSLQ